MFIGVLGRLRGFDAPTDSPDECYPARHMQVALPSRVFFQWGRRGGGGGRNKPTIICRGISSGTLNPKPLPLFMETPI